MLEPTTALDREYEGEAVTLRAARQDVLTWLSELGADEAAQQRAVLIVSELATNALQASPGRAYKVTGNLVDTDCAVITVRNHTSGSVPPDRDRWKFADRSALRGRGLAIVSSLSEDVTVDAGDNEIVVAVRIRL